MIVEPWVVGVAVIAFSALLFCLLAWFCQHEKAKDE